MSGELNFGPFLIGDVGLSDFIRRFGQPQIQLLPITAAPEQAKKRAVVASDQFALAVLLYFWLAGRPPYLGSPEEIEQLKLSESLTPLTSLNQHVTPEQEDILYRALAAHPEDRYPSMLAFADTLVASLTAPSYSATPPTMSSLPTAPLESITTLQSDSLLNPVQEADPQSEEANNSETFAAHQPSPEPFPHPAPVPLPLPAPQPFPHPSPDTLPLPPPEPHHQPP